MDLAHALLLAEAAFGKWHAWHHMFMHQALSTEAANVGTECNSAYCLLSLTHSHLQ